MLQSQWTIRFGVIVSAMFAESQARVKQCAGGVRLKPR
jgi:hypothetical protein